MRLTVNATAPPPAGTPVWCGLRLIYLAVSRGLDEELRTAHQLPLGEYELLRALAHPGCAQRMTGLAGAVGLSPSGLTRAIERLERRGLVRRLPCPADRRGELAELSEAGQALLERATVTHDAALRKHLLDHLSAAEAALLLSLWERLAGAEVGGCPLADSDARDPCDSGVAAAALGTKENPRFNG
ncbi:MAG: MarR family transcriptional regulator [Thermomicrobiales bacterium]|nr:MarR family transcriptional regulator [Thermomicrobiales bacterium]